jgi:hypothetical protein
LTVIPWPVLNDKPIGKILRSSNWNTPLGIIADQTRSGKYVTRLAHVKKPKTFNITMHMTLPEYCEFEDWFEYDCRKGLHAFAYPKINNNTGVLRAYQFAPDSEIGTTNTGADNLEITMIWMEAL